VGTEKWLPTFWRDLLPPSIGSNTLLGLLDQEEGRTALQFHIRVRISSTPLSEPTRLHGKLTPKTVVNKYGRRFSIYDISKTKRIARFGK
jgi:hypothetical protein